MENDGFLGIQVKNWGFSGKMVVLMGFWWKNQGFFEKWGFRGFLVRILGKSREEPGI